MAEYPWAPEEKQKLLAQVQSETPEAIVYAIKGVLALKKVKTMAITGADAGRWKKEVVHPIEKLVRIQAALLALPPELRVAVSEEAENRIQCVAVQAHILKRTPRKPWES